MIARWFYVTGHNMWLGINTLSLISPYFVCTVPFITMKIGQFEELKQTEKDKIDKSYLKKTLYHLGNTPLVLVYFIFMDFYFLFLVVILRPILLILEILTCWTLPVDRIQK